MQQAITRIMGGHFGKRRKQSGGWRAPTGLMEKDFSFKVRETREYF
jgi:hypothetical protein